MATKKNLKKLHLAKNLDELQAQADKIQTQFNDVKICNQLLKLYDKALDILNLNDEEIDEETAYVYLWRFIQSCLKIRNSKIYKNDKVYIDSLLSNKKQSKAINLIESLQKSLQSRYNDENHLVDNDLEKKNLIKEDKNENIKIVVKDDEFVLIEDDIKEILSKKIINPKELIKLIEKTNYKFLIIDCRTKSEFNFAHLNLDYILRGDCVDYINLNNDFIKPGLVLWKLEEILRNEKYFDLIEIINKRSIYDYLILFDTKSVKSDLNVADNKLIILKKAFFEFDQSDKEKCKNEPIILNGGWFEWIKFYPGYKKKNENFILTIEKDDQKIENEEKKNNINGKNSSFDVEFRKLEDNNNKIIKIENVESDEDNTVVSKSNIPLVDRKTKPSSFIINRNESENNNNNQKNIDFISKPTQPLSILPQQPINIISQPPAALQPLFVSKTKLATFQRPLIDFNQVYKPATENIYFLKPFKTNMNNGVVKYINPMTGTLDYVYDEDTKTQYTPNDVLPQNIMNINRENKPIFKPKIPERKKVNVEEPKSTLKRTFSSPNIEKLSNGDSVKMIITDDESDEDNTNNQSSILTLPESQKNIPNAENETNNSILKEINDDTLKSVSKPNVNRGVKPMPDNIKRLRLENLEPQWSNVTPGLTGIRNLGNTCFMNSIIQCLNNTKELKTYFLTETYRKDLNLTNPLGFGGEIADEFSIIVHALWWGHCKTIAPKRFKALIGQFNTQFIANDQQDAQEFLLFLLDGLHEDLNKIVERPRNLPEIDYDKFDDEEGARIAWEHHKKLNNSIIVDLFQGLFRSIVGCMSCKYQSVKFDAFMYLTLPVPQSKCSLYDCLLAFSKPERMTGESKWKCPKCKIYREAAKKIEIWSLPRLLIIHLKRFKYDGVWRDKIKTTVDYPIENLDLERFVLSKTNKNYKYKLYAISNHTGTLDGGHYTAFCKNEQLNRWFKYDDSIVKDEDLSSIKSASSSYILFYSSTTEN